MLKLDARLVEKYVGQTVLLGLTFLNERGEVVQRRQVFGRVASLDLHDGLVIRNEQHGEEYVLPPDLSDWEPAAPGDYVLNATGETVRDPAYLGTMVIEVPPDADLAAFEERDDPRPPAPA